jgi:hypothetical protein
LCVVTHNNLHTHAPSPRCHLCYWCRQQSRKLVQQLPFHIEYVFIAILILLGDLVGRCRDCLDTESRHSVETRLDTKPNGVTDWSLDTKPSGVSTPNRCIFL